MVSFQSHIVIVYIGLIEKSPLYLTVAVEFRNVDSLILEKQILYLFSDYLLHPRCHMPVTVRMLTLGIKGRKSSANCVSIVSRPLYRFSPLPRTRGGGGGGLFLK